MEIKLIILNNLIRYFLIIEGMLFNHEGKQLCLTLPDASVFVILVPNLGDFLLEKIALKFFYHYRSKLSVQQHKHFSGEITFQNKVYKH